MIFIDLTRFCRDLRRLNVGLGWVDYLNELCILRLRGFKAMIFWFYAFQLLIFFDGCFNCYVLLPYFFEFWLYDQKLFYVRDLMFKRKLISILIKQIWLRFEFLGPLMLWKISTKIKFAHKTFIPLRNSKKIWLKKLRSMLPNIWSYPIPIKFSSKK